jgi:hypothetical protein
MILSCPDPIVDQVFQALQNAPGRPEGLNLLDHDLLPVEEGELPVLGVYLVEDKQSEEARSDGSMMRTATVRLEIRAKGPMLSATRPIRIWASKVLASDPGLELMVFNVDHAAFTPFGIASNQRLAGADLDFVFTFNCNPSA